MQLLTEELRLCLPKLYSQRQIKMKNKLVYAKFFFPRNDWTWFVCEGEKEDEDFRFFGYIVGIQAKWGYFNLYELERINIRGVGVERDLYFLRGKFSEVINQFRLERGY